MIDTDKYEGHTEGPWTVFVYDNDDLLLLQIEGPTHTIAYDIDRPSNSSVGSNVPNNATANLIADAPLLLAEVKRLRYDIEQWKWELQTRMCPIEFDALVNGDEEE